MFLARMIFSEFSVGTDNRILLAFAALFRRSAFGWNRCSAMALGRSVFGFVAHSADAAKTTAEAATAEARMTV